MAIGRKNGLFAGKRTWWTQKVEATVERWAQACTTRRLSFLITMCCACSTAQPPCNPTCTAVARLMSPSILSSCIAFSTLPRSGVGVTSTCGASPEWLRGRTSGAAIHHGCPHPAMKQAAHSDGRAALTQTLGLLMRCDRRQRDLATAAPAVSCPPSSSPPLCSPGGAASWPPPAGSPRLPAPGQQMGATLAGGSTDDDGGTAGRVVNSWGQRCANAHGALRLPVLESAWAHSLHCVCTRCCPRTPPWPPAGCKAVAGPAATVAAGGGALAVRALARPPGLEGVFGRHSMPAAAAQRAAGLARSFGPSAVARGLPTMIPSARAACCGAARPGWGRTSARAEPWRRGAAATAIGHDQAVQG